MILNGAVIRFKTRTRLELNTQARFLFGKQIMHEDEAATPARKAYYALQQAYIGAEAERPTALEAARALIASYREQAVGGSAAPWEELLSIIADSAGFEALKRARAMIRAEESRPAPTTS